MKIQMKFNTGKKFLSVVLTFMMLLSFMAAIPVGAECPAYTATLADGTPFTNGMTSVPVVGTITFNFEGALADSYTGFLTLEEVKGGDSAVLGDALVVPQTKGTDGKSFTLNFTEGFLRPMGTYVLTLKTGFAAGGIALASDVSYTFTTGGNGYYIYDEFDRYQTYEDRNGTSAKRPWGGGATYSGQGVTTYDGEKALCLNVAAGRSAHSAYYPKYIPSDLPLYTSASGGQANALTTETEFDFKLAEGDAGTVVKFNNSAFMIKLDEADNDGLALYIGSERMCEVALNTRYTLRFVADYWSGSTIHTSSTEKRIRELTLSTETMPSSNLITTPIALSTSSQVKTAFTYDNTDSGYSNVFAVSAASTSAAKFYVYNYKHRPVVGVESINVAGDPLVKVGEKITVKFGDTPKAADGNTITEELMGNVPGVDGIVLEKIGGGIVTWSSDGYDATNNEIVLEPVVALDHNAQYKVTVPVRNYTLIGAGDAKVYTFTTGWEKLTATTATTAVTATNFTPDITVENITSGTVTYKSVLALYRSENGRVNQVASVVTPQADIEEGNRATINVGSVSDPNPSNTATYFAKVFLISGASADPVVGADALSEAIVIGTPVATTIVPVTSGASTVVFDPAPNPSLGRIDVQAKSVGSFPKRALWITVNDESNRVVYYDQQTNGVSSGDIAFGFNLNQGATTIDGDYTVTIKPSDVSSFGDAVEILFDSVLPSVITMDITGNAACGATLTAEYELYDFVERADNSIVTWQVASTANGVYTNVATGASYTISNEYIGQYIKCFVTPQVQGTSGVVTGSVYTSDVDAGIEPMHIVAIPTVSLASLNQPSGDNDVTVSYTYTNIAGHREYQSVYKWYIADAVGGTYTLLDTNQAVHHVTAAQNGKYIKAEITPCAQIPEGSDDIRQGEPVTTEPLQVTYTSTGGGGSLGGGGSVGGGGGGGSAGGVKFEEKVKEETGEGAPPAYQAPTENTDDGAVDLTDVRGHWAEKEIFELYDKGIITGRLNNEFDPDDAITRAEFAALLVRALGLETVSYNGSFADVKKGDWYADIIETAFKNGILEGSGGYASPNAPVTREQMTVMVVHAYEKYAKEIIVGGGFLDFEDAASISAWAREAVGKAKEAKLVNGTGDGMFSPDVNTTRAQCATITSRLLESVTIARDEAAAAAEAERLKAEAEAKAKAEAEAQAKAEEEQKKAEEEQKSEMEKQEAEDAFEQEIEDKLNGIATDNEII